MQKFKEMITSISWRPFSKWSGVMGGVAVYGLMMVIGGYYYATLVPSWPNKEFCESPDMAQRVMLIAVAWPGFWGGYLVIEHASLVTLPIMDFDDIWLKLLGVILLVPVSLLVLLPSIPFALAGQWLYKGLPATAKVVTALLLAGYIALMPMAFILIALGLCQT